MLAQLLSVELPGMLRVNRVSNFHEVSFNSNRKIMTEATDSTVEYR